MIIKLNLNIQKLILFSILHQDYSANLLRGFKKIKKKVEIITNKEYNQN